MLQLSYSSSVAVTVPPDSEDFRRAVRLLGPVFAFVLVVLVQAPAIGELWFTVAHLLLIALVSRRMPRMLNRSLAARPSVA